MEKERITTFVHKDIKDKLEAEKDDRTLSAHVAKVLTAHVSKQEVKPMSKQEYGKQ